MRRRSFLSLLRGLFPIVPCRSFQVNLTSLAVSYVTPTTPFGASPLVSLRVAVSCTADLLPCYHSLLRSMPRQAGGVRGGLTLEKLASFDDVITDALVDKVSRNLIEARNASREVLRRQSG